LVKGQRISTSKMANTGIYETVFKVIRFTDWNRKNPFTPKANG
jgi:hypothetical protein